MIITNIKQLTIAELYSILNRDDLKLYSVRKISRQLTYFDLNRVWYGGLKIYCRNVRRIINDVLTELRSRFGELLYFNLTGLLKSTCLYIHWWIDTSRKPQKGDPPSDAPIEALQYCELVTPVS